MTVVGGTRARFVHDSLHVLLDGALRDLGWFAAGRSHQPLRFISAPLRWDEPIRFNAITIFTRGRSNAEVEVGSNLTTDDIAVSVDIYGESDSFVVDLANDIRDILRGRLTDHALAGIMPILNLAVATPVPLAYAALRDIKIIRVPGSGTDRDRHWVTVDVTVVDSYYDESGPP